MKILIVEDDVGLSRVLRRGLAESGHVVDLERDGPAGESAALVANYDAIVLDVMLPGKDGLAVTRGLRSRGIAVPILMLTSRDTAEDAILGLDAGADDYLRKPFVFGELEARLRSLTRRTAAVVQAELQAGDIVLNLATRRVTRSGREIDLTAREIAFLEYLIRNAGLMLTRGMIEGALWENDRERNSNVIDVFVRRLRLKLSPQGEPSPIETVRGVGYRFVGGDG